MNPGDSPIIATQALSRDFKKTRAVSCLDLTIKPGELFGLVGPDTALVMVTHHMPLAEQADQILGIEQGYLREIK